MGPFTLLSLSLLMIFHNMDSFKSSIKVNTPRSVGKTNSPSDEAKGEVGLSRHLTISPYHHHHITISPHLHSPPHHLTISPYHHISISPPHHLTTSPYHHPYHHISTTTSPPHLSYAISPPQLEPAPAVHP